jgi:hypothetical protein
MGGVGLDGLDEIRDQVSATLELNLHAAPSLPHDVALPHKPIECKDQIDDESRSSASDYKPACHIHRCSLLDALLASKIGDIQTAAGELNEDLIEQYYIQQDPPSQFSYPASLFSSTFQLKRKLARRIAVSITNFVFRCDNAIQGRLYRHRILQERD